MAEILAGSLFSGILGFDLGLEAAGIHTAWRCEIDPVAASVAERQRPGISSFRDVRDIGINGAKLDGGFTQNNVRWVDLLCGGWPCQGNSVAGNRAGLRDCRSRLVWEFARLTDAIAPRWILGENVPGALTTHAGEDWAETLWLFSGHRPNVPRGGWKRAGLCIGPKRAVAWRVLDAQYFGVAQRRERVFVVCHPRIECAAQVLFESGCLPGDSPPSRAPGQEVAGTLVSRSRCGGSRTTDLDGHGAYFVSTVTANRGGVSGKDGIAGRVVVGAVSAKWSKGTGGPAGDETQNMIAATIAASAGHHGRGSPRGDGCDKGLVCQELADPLTANESRCYSHAGNNPRPRNVVLAFKQNSHGEGREMISNGDGAITANPGVRRLTPRECERLQGFPDDWTRWNADGHEIADTHRYRMIGNAVPVPMIEWIARRIVAMEVGNG